MYTGLIAKRYAGALLEFACSNGEAETVYAQARELVKYFSSDKHIKAEMAKSGKVVAGYNDDLNQEKLNCLPHAL
mgnify:CR=1 FL=1